MSHVLVEIVIQSFVVLNLYDMVVNSNLMLIGLKMLENVTHVHIGKVD